ncbi:hypothetical protein [Clavibacter michiganensis]|uniref:hypothetical protein n=1 Tax=Clavibacter michiganensis TaxID=28447 RepID=UPI002931DCC6|nr:hypothetical protein [Clavibacter michiganensis]
MDDVVRIEFEERDEQWFVTLYAQDGSSRPGEPFPASGHPRYPKDEQVRHRVEKVLGYEINSVSGHAPNGTHFVVEVKPK